MDNSSDYQNAYNQDISEVEVDLTLKEHQIAGAVLILTAATDHRR